MYFLDGLLLQNRIKRGKRRVEITGTKGKHGPGSHPKVQAWGCGRPAPRLTSVCLSESLRGTFAM